MSINIYKHLRQLAEAATRGTWKFNGGITISVSIGMRKLCIATVCTPSDGKFIAAASPQQVIALLDRIAELETKLEDAEKNAGRYRHVRSVESEICVVIPDSDANSDDSHVPHTELLDQAIDKAIAAMDAKPVMPIDKPEGK